MINWGLANQNGFQNALAQGMAYGQQIKRNREEKEYKNALAGYDPSNPETIKPIMQADPRLGLHLQQQAAAQQAAAHEADVNRRAAAGDPQAMAELAGLNLGAWRGLSADQKKAADEQTTVFANAAMDILQRPPEQRNAALNGYIDQFRNPEFEQYRTLQGAELEQALRGVIAQSDMITKLHEAERPRYQVIPEGGVLVDTRNPQAVQQFGRGNIPPPPPGFTIDGGSVGNGTGGF